MLKSVCYVFRCHAAKMVRLPHNWSPTSELVTTRKRIRVSDSTLSTRQHRTHPVPSAAATQMCSCLPWLLPRTWVCASCFFVTGTATTAGFYMSMQWQRGMETIPKNKTLEAVLFSFFSLNCNSIILCRACKEFLLLCILKIIIIYYY